MCDVADRSNDDIGVSTLTNKKFFVLDGSVEIELNCGFRKHFINWIVFRPNRASDFEACSEKGVVIEGHEMHNV